MASGEESFIVIRGFMIRKLKLQGVPLLLYARIYGFTVGGGRGCFESQGSMAKALGVSSRAIGKALKQLKDRGLVVEVGRYRLKNGRTTKVFQAVRPPDRTAEVESADGTKFGEDSSDVGIAASGETPASHPNEIPADNKRRPKTLDSKRGDEFDKYSF